MKTTFRFVLLLAAWCVLADPGTAAAQKPRWIPVTCEYSVPSDLKPGQEVTTVFVLTTTSFVPRLDVRMLPLKGLEWVEGPKNVTFENVPEGERREVVIKVRLAADHGDLSFTMQAVIGQSRFGDSQIVAYPRAK